MLSVCNCKIRYHVLRVPEAQEQNFRPSIAAMWWYVTVFEAVVALGIETVTPKMAESPARVALDFVRVDDWRLFSDISPIRSLIESWTYIDLVRLAFGNVYFYASVLVPSAYSKWMVDGFLKIVRMTLPGYYIPLKRLFSVSFLANCFSRPRIASSAISVCLFRTTCSIRMKVDVFLEGICWRIARISAYLWWSWSRCADLQRSSSAGPIAAANWPCLVWERYFLFEDARRMRCCTLRKVC